MRKAFISSLVLSIVVFSLPIVPIAQMSRPVSYPVAGPIRTSEFLLDLAESAVAENSDLYATEAKKIAGVIGNQAKKSPIVIDRTGNDRDLIMSAAAAKISSIAPAKRVLSIDWTGVFEKARSDKDVDAAVFEILLQAEASNGNDILYVDDVAIFSTDRPLLGKRIAQQFYDAIVTGRIQILAGTNSEYFTDRLSTDLKLKARLTRVEIDDEDPFVGDKLSPDLRALVGSTDANKKVRVILQSEDINNAALRRVLGANSVQIESRAENLDMLVVSVLPRVAEEIAAVRRRQASFVGS